MVGWIKMKLGMQAGLDPGHIVLDGDPEVLRDVAIATNFGTKIAMASFV